MYGHNYSVSIISNISKLVDKDVKAFNQRQVKDKYTGIYCDATLISLGDIQYQKKLYTL